MTTPPSHPNLTPQFCFSQIALRDFLRLSRSTIDDSISTTLNSLLQPSQSGFDPSSTRSRQPRSGSRLPWPTCNAFKEKVLYPSWKSRDDVLSYCAKIAVEDQARESGVDQNERLKVIDSRGDPYENRPQARFGKGDMLEDLIRNERGVERIIRERTWTVVKGRCSGSEDDELSWEDAMTRWNENRR